MVEEKEEAGGRRGEGRIRREFEGVYNKMRSTY